MWPHVGCYLSLWDGKNRLNLPVRVDVLVKVGTRGESSALFKCAAKRTSCGVTNMQGNGINGKTIEDKLLSLDRKSTRLNSSHVAISYAVFCLTKKKWECSTRCL